MSAWCVRRVRGHDQRTPRGFTWHHHEDMKTMLLAPGDLHIAVQHTGGVAVHKHASGVVGYGN